MSLRIENQSQIQTKGFLENPHFIKRALIIGSVALVTIAVLALLFIPGSPLISLGAIITGAISSSVGLGTAATLVFANSRSTLITPVIASLASAQSSDTITFKQLIIRNFREEYIFKAYIDELNTIKDPETSCLGVLHGDLVRFFSLIFNGNTFDRDSHSLDPLLERLREFIDNPTTRLLALLFTSQNGPLCIKQCIECELQRISNREFTAQGLHIVPVEKTITSIEKDPSTGSYILKSEVPLAFSGSENFNKILFSGLFSYSINLTTGEVYIKHNPLPPGYHTASGSFTS